MAKKEKNTGLGRGLDSLIPKIEETEVEEGIRKKLKRNLMVKMNFKF